MILLLDHDDSFVDTLARYVRELGGETIVLRPKDTSVRDLERLRPSHIILSPGPRTPRDCPMAIEVVQQLGARLPILGVCLGHQCIAAAYGASVARTSHPRHGSTSAIRHDGRGVFAGIPTPFQATRYHSLAVVAASIPGTLEISATSDDGDIMAIRHRREPVEGVQFHPESVLTEWGYRMLANFLGRDASGTGRAADTAAYASRHAD